LQYRGGLCRPGAADRKMYALRDVAGVVEAHPLIVSSILSKKAAARLDGLVLDVKVGGGGFAPSLRKARVLAARIVEASSDMGIRTEALLTSMEDPLGWAVGNALESRRPFASCAASAWRGSRGCLRRKCLRDAPGRRQRGAGIRGRILDAWRSGRALAGWKG